MMVLKRASLLILLLAPIVSVLGADLELAKAVIVAERTNPVVAKAAEMLQEEIEKRSGVRLLSAEFLPQSPGLAIVLAVGDQLPAGVAGGAAQSPVPEEDEAYGIWTTDGPDRMRIVHLRGYDSRGVMFAVGRLLRLLRIRHGSILWDDEAEVTQAPRAAFRGHQVGYRHTANSYDAWTVADYEQYIRDLIIFGANAPELVWEQRRGVKDGPVLEVPQFSMNVRLTELIHSYGLKVWIWEPLRGDVRDPAVAREELSARRDFYKECTAIDDLMVPGGDPGRTHPSDLMPWLQRHAALLHEYFPEAGLWVSNQKFTPEENDVFFAYLQDKKPDWLRGVVYGPSSAGKLSVLRARTPAKYAVRRYADITHNVRCQYPIPELDGILAQTLGREGINPRPFGTAHIHDVLADHCDGFVTYSDGVHDDLNKAIWSARGWGTEPDIDQLLEEYGRVFFGDDVASDVAEGLRLLEQNLVGKVDNNPSIEKAYAVWQSIADRSADTFSTNWRLQMYLFRATFDAHLRRRRVVEKGYEDDAYRALSRASQVGAEVAIRQAQEILAQADQVRVAFRLRKRLEYLGALLLNTIGFQFSVHPPYLARNPERGALLDKVDRPLNDRPWLETQFGRILAEKNTAKQLAEIDRLVHWEDPGPGGFYDDLGNSDKQPHLVRQTTWDEDPGFQRGPQEAHYRSLDNYSLKLDRTLKFSWLDQAQVPSEIPLLMRYPDLDPEATYRLRITYYGRFGAVVRLVADDKLTIHDALPRPDPIWPVEFPVPRAATADGVLDLTWYLVDRRGVQVAEIWLIREP
jgi:hypothetical protein